MTSSKNDPETSTKKSNFSIEHILNHAGPKTSENLEKIQRLVTFSWLNCTRYCPPKLARSQKRDGPQKRQLGRHPRIPFSSQQLQVLEEKFKQSPYLSSSEVTLLSRTLQLADIRVKIWFQNRRARERRERGDESGLMPTAQDTKVAKTNFLRVDQNVQNYSNLKMEENKTFINSYVCSLPTQKPRDNHFKNIDYFLDK